jgi:hypothetical protein
MSVFKVVPDEVSISQIVVKYWPTAIAAIFDGYPLEGHLEFIENTIAERERLLSQGMLDASFDWAADVATARKKQAENLRWIPTHQATRQGYIDFWRSVTIRMEEYSEKLAMSGMDLIVAFHGAVALGAIKILTEKESVSTLSTKAAIAALPLSLIGIGLFGVGKLVAYHVTATMAGLLKSKLINPKNSDFAALGAIVLAQTKPNNWARWLIYGSLFWFMFYSVVIVLILLE